MKNNLEKLYSPDDLRIWGKELIEKLSIHLEDLASGKKNAISYSHLDDSVGEWVTNFNTEQSKDFSSIVQKIIDKSLAVHSVNNVGHQISVPFIASIMGSILEATLNNSNAIYDTGAVSVAIEKVVVDFFLSKIGFGKDSSGFITSGATLGTLTALLSARAEKYPDIWEEGSTKKLGVLVSGSSHYSVSRAVQVMGYGSKGVVKMPTNDRFQINVSKLEETLKNSKANGIEVFALVANSCSTSTGSFDELEALADFCKKHNLWLHVDGAHGGGTILSEKYKHLVRGIDRADSVVIDFHKLLGASSLSSLLLFKSKKTSQQTFNQTALYLTDDGTKDWNNLFQSTFECTKNSSALRIYMSLKMYGVEALTGSIESVFDVSSEFSQLIKKESDFELLIRPMGNIICFRYLGNNADNDFNKKIKNTIIQKGKFFISSTELDGNFYLRTAIMNPMTNLSHLTELINHIREIAHEAK